MSQITLPWTEKNAETLRGFRRKAIAQLLFLGVVHLGIFALFCLWLEPGNADRLADWKIPRVWIGVIGTALAGLGLLAGGVAVISFRTIGAILRLPYFAFGLFLGGVVSICLIVWAHSWLFDFIQKVTHGSESHQIALVGIGYDYSVVEIFAALAERGLGVAMLAYAIWPLQFDLVRDLVALAGIIGFISIIPMFGIWWERKVAARIQSRMGPMRVGCWHGWLQSPADALKLVFKEDLVPAEGDPILFRLAPYITFIPPILAFIALPFAGAWVFRDLDVALIFILAMLGIEVLGVILAGWASNNKWSVYGAMREACQMVSYEIPMGMSLLIPIMMAGTLRLTDIADAQSGGFWNWYVFSNPWCFIAFFTYYIASLASCKRAPFDLPEAESELVAGFHTEYSGFRWSLFFFGEYVAMFAVSGLAVILFLGGWASPLPTDWAPDPSHWYAPLVRGLLFEGPILFVLKSAMLYYVQLWLRWTLPRIRIDQVLYACVQVLLPLTMVVLLANTLWLLGLDHLQWQWLIVLNTVLHWVLVAVGTVTMLSIIAVMAYGFANNRRLVGKLAVDALPGS